MNRQIPRQRCIPVQTTGWWRSPRPNEDCDVHALQHSISSADQDDDAYGDLNFDSHADKDSHTIPNGDCNADTDPHSNSDVLAKRNPDSYNYSDLTSHCHADTCFDHDQGLFHEHEAG